MLLQINDDYRVMSDPQNFILQQRSIIKDGKHKGEDTWKTLGYFPTLEYALERLIDKWLKEASAKYDSINELIDFIKNAKDEICAAIEKWSELQNA